MGSEMCIRDSSVPVLGTGIKSNFSSEIVVHPEVEGGRGCGRAEEEGVYRRGVHRGGARGPVVRDEAAVLQARRGGAGDVNGANGKRAECEVKKKRQMKGHLEVARPLGAV